MQPLLTMPDLIQSGDTVNAPNCEKSNERPKQAKTEWFHYHFYTHLHTHTLPLKGFISSLSSFH